MTGSVPQPATINKGISHKSMLQMSSIRMTEVAPRSCTEKFGFLKPSSPAG